MVKIQANLIAMCLSHATSVTNYLFVINCQDLACHTISDGGCFTFLKGTKSQMKVFRTANYVLAVMVNIDLQRI